MVTASALNIGQLVRGEEATHEATWNAICLADFGDSGVAFVGHAAKPAAQRQLGVERPWVHVAKVAFDHTSCNKVRAGTTEPYYEKMARCGYSISARSSAQRRNRDRSRGRQR